MVILCDGMARSGSTWSFNVALKLLRLCDANRRTFGVYSENPAVLTAAVRPRRSHLVIKSHELHPFAQELCIAGRIEAIYTWRNPYDALVSCSRMFGAPVNRWMGAMRNALRVWSFHQKTNSACIISYETIITRPSAAISRVASYLDLPVQPGQLRQIAEEVSFERMRRLARQMDQVPATRFSSSGGHIFDRETLLHANHIQNGGSGYGMKTLDEAQLSAMDAMLREEGFAFLCEPRTAIRRTEQFSTSFN